MRPQNLQSSARGDLLQHLPAVERRIDVDGIATSMLEGGQGPPLLLIHGGSQAGALLWWRVLPELCGRYRVLAPDLPGLGASEPMDTVDAGGFARWLRRLIDAACDEPPTVIAHSMPAALTARFAVRHGHLLRRLVLVDATGLGPFRPSPAFLWAALRLTARPSRHSLERFNRWPYRDPDRTRMQDAERHRSIDDYLIARASVPHVKRTMRQLIKAGARRIPEAVLGRLDVPTALVWGSHDRMVPLDHARTASAGLGWPLTIIDGAGHLPHIEQPAAFVDALVETARDA